MWIGENPEDVAVLSKVVPFVSANLDSYGINTDNLRVMVSNVSVAPPDIKEWLYRFFEIEGGIAVDVAAIREKLIKTGKNDVDERNLLYAIANEIAGIMAYRLADGYRGFYYDDDFKYSAAGWFQYTLFPEIDASKWARPDEKIKKLESVSDNLYDQMRDGFEASLKTAALRASLPYDEFMCEVVSTARRNGQTSALRYTSMLEEELQTEEQRNPNGTDFILGPNDFIDRTAIRLREADERITDEYPLRMRNALVNALKTAGSDPVAFWRAMAEQAANNINETTEGCAYISNALIAVVLDSYNNIGEGLHMMLKNPKLTQHKAVTAPKALEAIKTLARSLETLPVTYHVDLPISKEKTKSTLK